VQTDSYMEFVNAP